MKKEINMMAEAMRNIMDERDRYKKLLQNALTFMKYYSREVETADNLSCNVEIDEIEQALEGKE